MEELIFFAVLIFFSIIESIARSRKQRKGGGQLPELPGEAPPEWERQWEVERAERAETKPTPRPSPGPRPRMSDVPSYDDDGSFDSRAPTEEATSFDARASSETEPSFDESASSEAERRKRAASSESMIPSDIWEEIAGLAREAKVELPTPRPKPQPRLPKTQLPQQRRVPQPRPPAPKPPQRARPTAPPAREPTVPERQIGVEGTAAHPVHLSHAGYGTDPSERPRSAQDAAQPLVTGAQADASAVRRLLLSHGAHALRQALILHEVLGPPAASKPDRFSE